MLGPELGHDEQGDEQSGGAEERQDPLARPTGLLSLGETQEHGHQPAGQGEETEEIEGRGLVG